ncbi:hypothetical protein B0H17DRAFT_1134143 [Mycena rosella]|uniref:Uncharacterized protein n=1 Tax=Mycena rosella TaxID=1033263 RepID=A0AAD7DJA4_MYCRO|nr:hypothetical protein B0H17DRAFT_1134143 [Mycena rosella]
MGELSYGERGGPTEYALTCHNGRCGTSIGDTELTSTGKDSDMRAMSRDILDWDREWHSGVLVEPNSKTKSGALNCSLRSSRSSGIECDGRKFWENGPDEVVVFEKKLTYEDGMRELEEVVDAVSTGRAIVPMRPQLETKDRKMKKEMGSSCLNLYGRPERKRRWKRETRACAMVVLGLGLGTDEASNLTSVPYSPEPRLLPPSISTMMSVPPWRRDLIQSTASIRHFSLLPVAHSQMTTITRWEAGHTGKLATCQI